jgi:selenocysteine-specific elongation factor
MKACPVVVVGHVDHGKTALVRALTGPETDRLDEERRRGMSIVPGYAFCAWPEGVVDLIDAPGHADFIRAMVSGAAGARTALLVVSLAEGVQAQTLEHLRIVALLGVETVLVALSKADLCTREDRAARRFGIECALREVGWTGDTMVTCSARTGEGIGALQARLREILHAEAADVADGGGALLPVDRVFTAKGQGTVVTGTLIGKELHLGERLTLWPVGQPVGLRGMQSRGEPRERVVAGERVALNLRGIDANQIEPGALVAGPGIAGATTRIDIRLDMADWAGRGLRHMEEVRVHFGTASATAKLALFGLRAVVPGQVSYAQLRFARPVAAVRGQRALVRAVSPARTLGGARFLDIAASAPRSGSARRRAVLEAADRADRLALALALCTEGRGHAALGDLARLSGETVDAVTAGLGPGFRCFAGGSFASVADAEACEKAVLSALDTFHRTHRLKTVAPLSAILAGLSHRALCTEVVVGLTETGRIRVVPDGVALADHCPEALLTPRERERMTEIESEFENSGAKPPDLADVAADETDADLIALLVHDGCLVVLENVALRRSVLFHVGALKAAFQRLTEAFPPPHAFTTSEARSALGTTRKFIVPMLEHFDRQGVTRREGDQRWLRAGSEDDGA